LHIVRISAAVGAAGFANVTVVNFGLRYRRELPLLWETWQSEHAILSFCAPPVGTPLL
jgi:hypothetical protein